MGDENKIRDAADAVKGLVEAVPVYEDVLQPAAREVGQGLQTVAKTIHIALAPVSALVWGYDKLKDYLEERLAEKLKKVPPEKIITPNPAVAVPAVESMRYTAHDPTLRELYASLLASAMNKDAADSAHPAFAEMIRQMTADEARLMKAFALAGAHPMISVGDPISGQIFPRHGNGDLLRNLFILHFSTLPVEAQCSRPELFQTYLGNLGRLGLVEVKERYDLAGADYEALGKHPYVAAAAAARGFTHPGIRREAVVLTAFGRQFCEACVNEDDE